MPIRPFAPGADDVVVGTPACADSYAPVPWLSTASITMMLVGLVLLAATAYALGRHHRTAETDRA